jgi:hypothetical protein
VDTAALAATDGVDLSLSAARFEKVTPFRLPRLTEAVQAAV